MTKRREPRNARTASPAATTHQLHQPRNGRQPLPLDNRPSIWATEVSPAPGAPGPPPGHGVGLVTANVPGIFWDLPQTAGPSCSPRLPDRPQRDRPSNGPRALSCADSDKLQFGADVDGALKAARDRAETGMEAMDSLDLPATLLGNPEPIANGDAADDKNLVLEHNLAGRLDLVALRMNLDLTRLPARRRRCPPVSRQPRPLHSRAWSHGVGIDRD